MTATVEQTTWALQHLPGWARLLPEALRCPRKSAGPSGRSGDPAERSLYSLEISALLDQTERHLPMPVFGPRGAIPAQRMGIRPALATWAAALEVEVIDADAIPLQPLADGLTIAELCMWLRQRDLQAWAETHWDEWPEYSDDILSLTTRTYTAVTHILDEYDGAPDPDPVCGRCHAGRLRDTYLGFRCDHCGRWATVKPVTILEAAQATGHPRATLFRWVKEGRFTRILGDDGKPRYDLGEIWVAVSAARLSSARNAAHSPAGPDVDTTTPALSEVVRSPHNG
jgi:hypothetical protein